MTSFLTVTQGESPLRQRGKKKKRRKEEKKKRRKGRKYPVPPRPLVTYCFAHSPALSVESTTAMQFKILLGPY
jgi:hypothetical protein